MKTPSSDAICASDDGVFVVVSLPHEALIDIFFIQMYGTERQQGKINKEGSSARKVGKSPLSKNKEARATLCEKGVGFVFCLKFSPEKAHG